MKKEVFFVLVFVLVFFSFFFFLSGGITGLVVSEEPRFRVIVSLNVPNSSFSGAFFASKDFSDENLVDNMLLRAASVQNEVVSNVNSKGLFSFMKEGDVIVEKKFDVIPAMVLNVTEKGLISLFSNPLVDKVYSDSFFSIDLSDSVPQINASFVFSDFNVSGRDVGICVIDTGIDHTHPAFSGRIVAQKCFCSSGCCPNGLNEDFDAFDDNSISHGTHVSGIAASNGSFKGVAPEANIIAVKVCDKSGVCYTSDVISGIDFCVRNKFNYNIDIISGSIGDGGGHSSGSCPGFIDPALDAASSLGIFLVFASGNNGFTTGVSYPACYRDAISVGAVSKSDVIASFSNRGPNLDLLAPGVSILSSVRGGSYSSLSGTSQATPHVSGMIALLLDFSYRFNLSRTDVIDSLNITDVFVGGFPRINVGMALSYLSSLVFGYGNSTGNLSPEVNVVFPLNNSFVNKNITLIADVVDDFGFNLTNSSWFSDLQGFLGVGKELNVSLVEGDHVLTFSVSFAENLTINRSVFVRAGYCFIDFDRNLNSQLDIGDAVILYSEFVNGSLIDFKDVCSSAGLCLFEFDQNNNSVYDFDDFFIIFNDFLNETLKNPFGELCFS
jgi:subtilisin family serine protease